MTPHPQEGQDNAVPLAMAALDVAGAIRERSPTDMALFGEAAGRLADRFLAPEAGLALLARAVSEGNAEAVAWLVTAAGQRRFRVSLWRQRGGERIRVLATFAACGQPAPETPGPEAIRETASRLGEDMRAPLEAVAGFAGMLRGDGAGRDPGEVAAHAADIVAAAWRLRRLAGDLLAACAAPGGQPPQLAGEVDIARLVRRIARLAGPAAREAGVTILLDGVPEPGASPVVLGDESVLWSVVEGLLGTAIHHGGQGAAVAFTLAGAGGGLTLEIAGADGGVGSERLAGLLDGEGRLAAYRSGLRANGADLAIASSPGTGFTAVISFPAARCLSPA